MGNWPATKAARVLAALKRIGWREKRRHGSHITLERPGWPNYVWSAHDSDEIGPAAFRKYIEKQTGLKPEDL
jgi:predicted RNA binding protein YcfA (HicA-like mRNA interferase family)